MGQSADICQYEPPQPSPPGLSLTGESGMAECTVLRISLLAGSNRRQTPGAAGEGSARVSTPSSSSAAFWVRITTRPLSRSTKDLSVSGTRRLCSEREYLKEAQQ